MIIALTIVVFAVTGLCAWALGAALDDVRETVHRIEGKLEDPDRE